jgi:hypothetical protein
MKSLAFIRVFFSIEPTEFTWVPWKVDGSAFLSEDGEAMFTNRFEGITLIGTDIAF